MLPALKKYVVFYAVYSLLVLWALAAAEYWGLGVSDVDEIKDVPKSVRENPGSYRSHYAYRQRHYGGK